MEDGNCDYCGHQEDDGRRTLSAKTGTKKGKKNGYQSRKQNHDRQLNRNNVTNKVEIGVRTELPNDGLKKAGI